MIQSISEDYKFTQAEALAWVKRAPKGARFYAHVQVDVLRPAESDSPRLERRWRAVKLARAEAIKLIEEYIRNSEADQGLLIPCSMNKSFGVAYWIG